MSAVTREAEAPRTEAGKRLLAEIGRNDINSRPIVVIKEYLASRIADIEAEAATPADSLDAQLGIETEYRRRYPAADVALAIAAIRAEEGWTQEELAVKVKTTQSAIARAESGRHNVSIAFLRRIAAATGRKLVIGFDRE